MSTNLYAANQQWQSRPADERFWNLADLKNFLQTEKKASAEKSVPLVTVQPKAVENNVCLVGSKGVPCKMTNWSFGQLCSYAEAPADYLRTLPANLAVQNLSYGLEAKKRAGDDSVQLLLHQNKDQWTARAVTTTDYSRLWNLDLVNGMMPAIEHGWRTPPARPATDDPRTRIATAEDIVPNQKNFGLSVKVGDKIAPAGVYCGDRDMFVFLVHPAKIIDDGGLGLMRGVFIQNSEVRACSFKATSFLMESVCGNHIVWNASGVQEFRFYHRGDIYSRFRRAIETSLHEYAELDTGAEEKMIAAAKVKMLGTTIKDATESLFNNKRLGLTLETIKSSMDYAVQWEHTAKAVPNSVWGFVHGLTRYSQDTLYADRRAKLDAAGGKLLALAV